MGEGELSNGAFISIGGKTGAVKMVVLVAKEIKIERNRGGSVQFRGLSRKKLSSASGGPKMSGDKGKKGTRVWHDQGSTDWT